MDTQFNSNGPGDFFGKMIENALGEDKLQSIKGFSGKPFVNGEEISSDSFFSKLADTAESGMDKLVGRSIEKPAYDSAVESVMRSRNKSREHSHER